MSSIIRVPTPQVSISKYFQPLIASSILTKIMYVAEAILLIQQAFYCLMSFRKAYAFKCDPLSTFPTELKKTYIKLVILQTLDQPGLTQATKDNFSSVIPVYFKPENPTDTLFIYNLAIKYAEKDPRKACMMAEFLSKPENLLTIIEAIQRKNPSFLKDPTLKTLARKVLSERENDPSIRNKFFLSRLIKIFSCLNDKESLTETLEQVRNLPKRRLEDAIFILNLEHECNQFDQENETYKNYVEDLKKSENLSDRRAIASAKLLIKLNLENDLAKKLYRASYAELEKGDSLLENLPDFLRLHAEIPESDKDVNLLINRYLEALSIFNHREQMDYLKHIYPALKEGDEQRLIIKQKIIALADQVIEQPNLVEDLLSFIRDLETIDLEKAISLLKQESEKNKVPLTDNLSQLFLWCQKARTQGKNSPIIQEAEKFLEEEFEKRFLSLKTEEQFASVINEIEGLANKPYTKEQKNKVLDFAVTLLPNEIPDMLLLLNFIVNAYIDLGDLQKSNDLITKYCTHEKKLFFGHLAIDVLFLGLLFSQRFKSHGKAILINSAILLKKLSGILLKPF